ncbi:MAG: glycogen synthase GlgA [Candidatus Omnitrophota bacterium]|nr:glycogen synthase GlgA [Candidatus Omnitrophota bacterium]
MKILHLSSEVAPFAKTGGLADMTAALPKALVALGHEVRIAMPLYRCVDRKRYGVAPTPTRCTVKAGAVSHDVRVWEATLPESPVVTYFFECAPLFDREELYQEQGRDYPDNLERFSVFSQALLRVLPELRWQPDVIHCHDWQTALVCAHLSVGPAASEPWYAPVATVLTIHNLAYQGLFPKAQWPLTGLPEAAFTVDGLEYYGQINCLKGGLISAGSLTTVSPTYAREIQSAAFGCGLEGVLSPRAKDLAGIVNGIDPQEWDPRRDPHLPARYRPEELAGKAVCKLELQRRCRLPQHHGLLIGMIQRLTEQKGLDLFLEGAARLLALPLQVVMLGTGDPAYSAQLQELAKQFPERLAVALTFDDALAHQIEAGADAFLMPSRFEPCGLNQLYSMRYGTVPIVRRVGGLADTVTDLTPLSSAAQTATGFVFEDYTAGALVGAVRRAVAAFRDHKLWNSLMATGMRQDVSWSRSAREYVIVYERTIAKHQMSKTTMTK